MRNLLFITMLLGVGYSWECEEYNEIYGTNYNCDCNEDTWQEYYNSEDHNMAGCYLYQAHLSYTNLEGANLQGANLSWANLAGAWLIEANLQGAFLYQAGLYGAYLTNADFTNAYCYTAFFVYAILEGTIFDGANLTYAYFDVNWDGYDDVSYDAGYDTGAQSGDLNLDGIDNILDIVILANNILEN